MSDMPAEATGNRLAQALKVAIRVHAGQVDKQGEPYLLHVLRVVEAVSDEAKVVAALHDVCEDSDLTPDTIASETPITHREQTDISFLTRKVVSGQSYQGYINVIAGCSSGSLAREVKLADLRDNLARIPPRLAPRVTGIARSWDQEWASLKARYEKAIDTLEAGLRG